MRSHFLLVIFALISGSAVRGDDVSADQVLSHLKASFRRALSAEFAGESSAFVKGWNLAQESQISDSTFRVTSSERYWAIQIRNTSHRLLKGQLLPQLDGFDYVLGPDGAMFCEWFDNEAKHINITGPEAETNDDLKKSFAIGYLGVSSLVFGYLDGNSARFLPDLLKGADAEYIPDSEIIALRRDGEYGRWEVRVSTETWLPTYVSIDLDENDYFGSQRIREYVPSSDSDQLYPNRKLQSVERTITFSSKTLADGDSFIAGLSSRQRMAYDGNIVLDWREVLTIRDVAQSPTSSFQFATFAIPDGTPVYLTENPQLPYVWEGGRVVPYVPKIDQPDLPFRDRSMRLVLLIANIAIIALLGGLLWWRRRHVRSSAR